MLLISLRSVYGNQLSGSIDAPLNNLQALDYLFALPFFRFLTPRYLDDNNFSGNLPSVYAYLKEMYDA